MSEQAGERTEQATTRRREDARRKGQVASSREVSIATSLTATVAAGSFMGVYAIGLLTTTMQRWLAACLKTPLPEPNLCHDCGTT